MNYLTGDIWTTTCDRIVVPVNCVGVPGKGLALQWAQRDAAGVARYKEACQARELSVGGILSCGRVLALATKNHWRNPSRLIWISAGLHNLATYLGDTGFSLALPQVGCGLGGLSWSDVRPLVEEILDGYSVDIYEASL